MLHLLKVIFVLFWIILTLGVIALNGIYMLICPRKFMLQKRWFLLPGALRHRHRYASGKADWELRVGGAVTPVAIGYLVRDIFLH